MQRGSLLVGNNAARRPTITHGELRLLHGGTLSFIFLFRHSRFFVRGSVQLQSCLINRVQEFLSHPTDFWRRDIVTKINVKLGFPSLILWRIKIVFFHHTTFIFCIFCTKAFLFRKFQNYTHLKLTFEHLDIWKLQFWYHCSLLEKA